MGMTVADFTGLPARFTPLIQALVAALIATAIALVLHYLIVTIACRLARRNDNPLDDALVGYLRGPTRWIAVAIALSIAARSGAVDADIAETWARLVGFIMPALIGWQAINLLRYARAVVELRSDIAVADNLAARRKRTRIGILVRIGTFLILFLTICMMLFNIPGVRSVGVTLMASAGLAGLAVGAAAQPALKNLIAGIQMAFTEPIRIDDVVIMDGEWGRIEDIRLTYVVIRIWDDRRLIVPVSKFLEESFQNWTRETSAILGTAFLYVDPAADVPAIRAKLEEVVRGNANWDGRVIGLQVTDVRADVMELRALVSAADAGRAFDLRCDVREAMMSFLARAMPEALPRARAMLGPLPGPGMRAGEGGDAVDARLAKQDR